MKKSASSQWIINLAFLVVLFLGADALSAYKNKPDSIHLLPTGSLLITPTASVFKDNDSIRGIVVDEKGKPVAGATVRVKTTQVSCTTDSEGHFTLTHLTPGERVILTSWASGYYGGGGEESFLPGTNNVTLTMVAHFTTDNPDYQWLSAYSDAGYSGSGETLNCQNCHDDANDEGQSLPFSEWKQDAHALSAQNPRFLSMYLGTDVKGNQSPPTKYFNNRDYGKIPLRPDVNQPYYGPGYKLDFPDSAGNCATCHTPAAITNSAYSIDPTTVSGVGQEGVTCDLCHKVVNVQLNETTQLPNPNMTGVLSFEFLRPEEGTQFFSGPYDDVATGHDSYSSLQKDSQFCSSCHYAKFWDTVVYNSYGEWLESPYSDPVQAKASGLDSTKACQDCHMPTGNNTLIALASKGGNTRDPSTIYSHQMLGASDETLLQNTVTLTANAKVVNKELIVDVSIFNANAGHDVPTDSPLRQMILLVSATGPNNQTLSYIHGPTVPNWGGVGDPGKGDYAGLPGKGYAKILSELWTGISPSGAYWNQTQIVSDNRIPALGADSSSYVFSAAQSGVTTVQVSLYYRRAFKEMMDQKGWDTPDILMESQVIQIEGE